MVRIFKALMPRFGMLFALLQIGRLLLKAGKLLMTIRKFLPKMRKVSSEKRWLCIYISFQKTVRLNSLKDYPELRFRSCIDNGNPDQRWKGIHLSINCKDMYRKNGNLQIINYHLEFRCA